MIHKKYLHSHQKSPNNPNPANNATGAWTETILSWDCFDPNEEDTLTYDVYFGTDSSPTCASTGQTAKTYDPGTLATDTTYYWRVDVSDGTHEVEGDVWSFATGFEYNFATYTVTLEDGDSYGFYTSEKGKFTGGDLYYLTVDGHGVNIDQKCIKTSNKIA